MFVEYLVEVCLTCCLSYRLPFIFITIYDVCVQLAHFSIGDWKNISIAHLIIIIKSEVSTFPMTFSVVVCLRCLLHHILSLIAFTFRENWGFVFIINVQFMMSANSRMRFGLQVVFAYLYITPTHYHHCANCVFPVYPFPLWWLREYIYTLCYYHHQIGSMNYYPSFRVRSWNGGMRCMSLYIPMSLFGHYIVVSTSTRRK